MSSAAALQASGLWFSYGRANGDAIQDVSVELAAGELAALIGPNGSGKSTLLRHLSGSLPPRRGQVQLWGQDLSQVSPRQRAKEIAFVPQKMEFAFPFRAEEIVAMGRAPYQGWMGVGQENDREIVERSMAMAGVQHLMGRRIDQLSGGEAQRVALARALAQETRILLLDEPTSHLDIHFQAELMELLRALHQQRGISILLSLHDLNLASLFCERVLLMCGGRMHSQGTPSEVLTAATLQEIYGASVGVALHPQSGLPWVSVTPKSGP